MTFSKKLLLTVIVTSVVMVLLLLYGIFSSENTKICMILGGICFGIFLYVFLVVSEVNLMIPEKHLMDEHNKNRNSILDVNHGFYHNIMFSIVTKAGGKKREMLLKKHFSFLWLFITISIILILIQFFDSIWVNLLDANNNWYIAPADSGEAFFDVLSRSGLGWNYLVLFFMIVLLIIFGNFIRKNRKKK